LKGWTDRPPHQRLGFAPAAKSDFQKEVEQVVEEWF